MEFQFVISNNSQKRQKGDMKPCTHGIYKDSNNTRILKPVNYLQGYTNQSKTAYQRTITYSNGQKYRTSFGIST